MNNIQSINKLKEEGERIMQELWMELGYRIAEEDEGYIALAKWYNQKKKQALTSQLKELDEDIHDWMKLGGMLIVENHLERYECLDFISKKLAQKQAKKEEISKLIGEIK